MKEKLRAVTCISQAMEHKHKLERISAVKKDDSQPRAFSYIYAHEGTFKLFFIKMAHLVSLWVWAACCLLSQLRPEP